MAAVQLRAGGAGRHPGHPDEPDSDELSKAPQGHLRVFLDLGLILTISQGIFLGFNSTPHTPYGIRLLRALIGCRLVLVIQCFDRSAGFRAYTMGPTPKKPSLFSKINIFSKKSKRGTCM